MPYFPVLFRHSSICVDLCQNKHVHELKTIRQNPDHFRIPKIDPTGLNRTDEARSILKLDLK